MLCLLCCCGKVYSHQFLYVYVRAYETGGAFSGPTLARFFFLALVVGHLTLIGHLIRVDATHQAVALAPLVLFTLRSPTRCADGPLNCQRDT